MYPLPMAPQECYTKWFRHKITKSSLSSYEVVWVGKQLNKRFRADPNVSPENIFICQNGDKFEYILIDSTDDIHKLPKKYYTVCFPGIQYSNVPKNNRMKVRLTNKITLELPYIPQAFLESKKHKTRKRRRLLTSKSTSEQHIDFNQQFPRWHVLQNDQNDIPIKKEIMLLIRSLVKYTDKNNNYAIKDPFEGIRQLSDIKKNKELLSRLNIISGFVYHYCRSELGIVNDVLIDSTEYLLKMNSVE